MREMQRCRDAELQRCRVAELPGLGHLNGFWLIIRSYIMTFAQGNANLDGGVAMRLTEQAIDYIDVACLAVAASYRDICSLQHNWHTECVRVVDSFVMEIQSNCRQATKSACCVMGYKVERVLQRVTI